MQSLKFVFLNNNNKKRRRRKRRIIPETLRRKQIGWLVMIQSWMAFRCQPFRFHSLRLTCISNRSFYTGRNFYRVDVEDFIHGIDLWNAKKRRKHAQDAHQNKSNDIERMRIPKSFGKKIWFFGKWQSCVTAFMCQRMDNKIRMRDGAAVRQKRRYH